MELKSEKHRILPAAAFICNCAVPRCLRTLRPEEPDLGLVFAKLLIIYNIIAQSSVLYSAIDTEFKYGFEFGLGFRNRDSVSKNHTSLG